MEELWNRGACLCFVVGSGCGGGAACGGGGWRVEGYRPTAIQVWKSQQSDVASVRARMPSQTSCSFPNFSCLLVCFVSCCFCVTSLCRPIVRFVLLLLKRFLDSPHLVSQLDCFLLLSASQLQFPFQSQQGVLLLLSNFFLSLVVGPILFSKTLCSLRTLHPAIF